MFCDLESWALKWDKPKIPLMVPITNDWSENALLRLLPGNVKMAGKGFHLNCQKKNSKFNAYYDLNV